MSSALSYRPDIDGLRALAVLAVVFFHLGAAPLSGGFVGVDIFFVLSGYLITSIIVKDIQAGAFSLAHFYERRILRILPMLFTLLAVSLFAGWFLLFPSDFDYFGETVMAVSAFGSNLLFWKQSGYFEMNSHFVPLLHTWSLAVEEQFYIVFPLVLMAVYKFLPQHLIRSVIALAMISFGITLYAVYSESYGAMFYLLPMRAWELLLGSVLAMGIVPPLRSERAVTYLSIFGLFLILYAVFCFNEEMVFPGTAALVPTVGACLLLYTGMNRTGLVYAVLSKRLPVFFGKISYSLYLWHWLVIVFFKYAAPVELKGWIVIPVFTVCVGLACLSWKFIEQPCRYQKRFSRRTVFIAAVSGMFVFAAAGFVIHQNKGFPDRFPLEIQNISKVSIGIDLSPIENLQMAGYNSTVGDPDAKASFLLWGDSHAYAALPGIDEIARASHVKGYFFGTSGCMPAMEKISIMEKDCNETNAQVVEYLKHHPEIKKVILLGFWSAYEERLQREAEEGVAEDFSSHMAALIAQLQKEGREIAIVLEVPQAPVEDIVLYMARAAYYHRPVEAYAGLSVHERRQKNVQNVFTVLVKGEGIKMLDPADSVCPKGVCPITHDGALLYYDDDHLSTYGALRFKDMYKPLFE